MRISKTATIYMYLCMCVFMYVCMYVCVYVCVYVCLLGWSKNSKKYIKNSDVSTSLKLFHYHSITRIKIFKLIGGDLEVAPYDDFQFHELVKLGCGQVRLRVLLDVRGENGVHFRTQWGRLTLRNVQTDDKLIIDQKISK